MRLVILASGTGTLAQAIIDSDFEILSVVSENPQAEVLQRAAKSKIPNKIIEIKGSRTEWDQELFDYVQSLKPDLVVCAGFMKILDAKFVDHFKVINSHPALLPKFPGAHAVEDALKAGEQITGCTIHWVDAGVDTGVIIAQEKVSIEPGDDAKVLHERIKIVERKLIVKTIRELQDGTLR